MRVLEGKVAGEEMQKEGFEFFGYAMNALVAHDTVPGRTNLWGEFLEKRGNRTEEMIQAAKNGGANSGGIGTPDDLRKNLGAMEEAGVDQVIFLQQAGRNKHEHICQALELFAAEVMPEFKAEVAEREAAKARDLAPFLEAAMARLIKDGVGKTYTLVIDGKPVKARTFSTKSPADHRVNIGKWASGTKAHARQAVAAAKKGFPAWAATPWKER